MWPQLQLQGHAEQKFRAIKTHERDTVLLLKLCTLQCSDTALSRSIVSLR